MKLFKRLFTLLVLILPSQLLATDLALTVTGDEKYGYQIYVQNIGNKALRLPTRDFAYIKQKQHTEMKPNKYSRIVSGSKQLLKSSDATIGVVKLNPGETTYLDALYLKAHTGKLIISISETWGQLHETWYGEITAKY